MLVVGGRWLVVVLVPAKRLSHALVTAPQAVGRAIRLAFLLILLGVVAQPQLDRIQLKRFSQLIHRRLERKGALDIAGRAEGHRRPRVGVYRNLLSMDVRAAIQRLV